MLLIIDWIIIGASALAGFGVGFTIGYFWDEIKAWAIRAIEYIIAQINRAITAISDAIVYLVKSGQRVYKRVEIFSRNIFTKVTKCLSDQEEVNINDLPEELKNQLDYDEKLKLMQASI